MDSGEPGGPVFEFVFTAALWIGFFWLMQRAAKRRQEQPERPPPRTMSAGMMVLIYAFAQIGPLIEYLGMKIALRRRKRVVAFLKLADDLWMRQKRVYRRLPFRPRR